LAVSIESPYFLNGASMQSLYRAALAVATAHGNSL